MPTLNELYFNEAISRNLIFLDFTEQQVSKVSQENDRLEEALLIALVKQYTLEGQTRANILRLRKRLDTFESIYRSHYRKIERIIESDFKGIGISEFEFNSEFFRENLGTKVNIKQLSSGIMKGIGRVKTLLGRPILGTKEGSWFKDLSKKEFVNFRTRVQSGFAEGLSIADIIKNVKGTKALNYKDGVFKGSKRNLETLVRTSYTFVQQEANKQLFNELGATHLRYSAILDGRTTFICGQRDGNIYVLIEAPIIPAHFNCRSTYVSVFDVNLIAEANTIQDPRDRRRNIIHFKTEARTKYGSSAFDKLSLRQQRRIIQAEREVWARVNIGNPVGRIKYRDWFEKRSDAWKIARLGKKRFDLYKLGRLKYIDLINRSGKPFTIKELNDKYNIIRGK